MNHRIYMIILILFTFATNSHSQIIATFELDTSYDKFDSECPVSINLDNITSLSENSLSLYKVNGDERKLVPFQIKNGEHRTLNWLIASNDTNKLIYELVEETIDKEFDFIRFDLKEGALEFSKNDRKFLRYQYQTLYPPADVDTVFKRSGFIHPLWTPNGQVLTQIQPEDHYHHYGIWNPWTKVLFESDTLDFWNLAKKQGTVRFSDFVSITEGPIFSGYEALQKHTVLKKNNAEKVAINELQSVRIYNTDDSDYYIADIKIQLNCASKSPVHLLKYRYGGFSWRATEKWNKDNSEVLTSENKTRVDADGSLARWCIVQGEIDNDYAGIVMMSDPANYNHPEPLRIWPENQNGRGDLFVNFSPTKNSDWFLEPGKTYVLKYRLIVFNGYMSKEIAETAWQYFANKIKVNIKKG